MRLGRLVAAAILVTIAGLLAVVASATVKSGGPESVPQTFTEFLLDRDVVVLGVITSSDRQATTVAIDSVLLGVLSSRQLTIEGPQPEGNLVGKKVLAWATWSPSGRFGGNFAVVKTNGSMTLNRGFQYPAPEKGFSLGSAAAYSKLSEKLAQNQDQHEINGFAKASAAVAVRLGSRTPSGAFEIGVLRVITGKLDCAPTSVLFTDQPLCGYVPHSGDTLLLPLQSCTTSSPLRITNCASGLVLRSGRLRAFGGQPLAYASLAFAFDGQRLAIRKSPWANLPPK